MRTAGGPAMRSRRWNRARRPPAEHYGDRLELSTQGVQAHQTYEGISLRLNCRAGLGAAFLRGGIGQVNTQVSLLREEKI